MYRLAPSREMFSSRTRLTAVKISAGAASGRSSTSVRMLVWVIIMTSPDSTPCPETSPIATKRRPSPASMMS